MVVAGGVAGRRGGVTGDGLERPTNSMGGRAEEGVALAVSGLLTSSMGGNTGECAVERVVPGAGREAVSLGAGRPRTTGTAALLTRCSVAAFSEGTAWRVIAGGFGAGDLVTGFAMAGAFGETGTTGRGVSAGLVAAGGGVLTLLSRVPSGIGAALTVFSPAGFLVVMAGDRSATAGDAMALREAGAAVDVDGSVEREAAPGALGATEGLGLPGGASGAVSATAAVVGGADGRISAAGSAGVPSLVSVSVAGTVSAAASVAEPADVATEGSSLDAGGASSGDVAVVPATVSSARAGSDGEGCSGCDGFAEASRAEFADAIESGAGIDLAATPARVRRLAI